MIENQAAPRYIVPSSHNSVGELKRNMLNAYNDEQISRMVLQLFVVAIVANKRLKTLEGPVKLIFASPGVPALPKVPTTMRRQEIGADVSVSLASSHAEAAVYESCRINTATCHGHDVARGWCVLILFVSHHQPIRASPVSTMFATWRYQ
jgi:hypothetical protein